MAAISLSLTHSLLCVSLSLSLSIILVVRAAVVAQAVEQQISVRAGWVRIPGLPSAFFGRICLFLAGRWVFLLE